MATEFGTGKSVFILAIVLGCFAVLWPKIFYPMLQDTVTVKPNIMSSQDCCDVIFDKDLNAIKVMLEVCEKILLRSQNDYDKNFILAFQKGKLNKEIINRCKNEVLSKCDIDITSFLLDKVHLGKTYKQILDEIRSLNSSLCLKQNFGVAPGLIGAPRRMRIWAYSASKHIRQERPSHLHPDTMHPALREKGRAITIPPEHIIPKVQEREAPSKPMPPMPGMRPPMGGAGHVVPAPKGSGTMGIVMPLYTIGIVIFFMYTMMKLIFKKSEESSGYKNLEPDPEFRRVVFNDMNYGRSNIIQNTPKQNEDNKLGDLELDQLRRRLQETEKAMERIVAQMGSVPHKEKPSPIKDSESDLKDSIEDSETKKIMEKGEEEKCAKVQVVGMEMTESIEGGQRWSRPPTPLSRGATPIPPQQNQEPQHIFLEGSLPSQSQLLVSQSETQTLPPNDDDDSSVILAGKVTLSLIGLDAGLKADIEEQVISDYDEEEEEEEDEVGDEEVSDDDAEVEDGVNGDEDPTTNYTTASVIGPDETAAEFSLADALAQDVADEENEIEYDEGIVNGQEDSEEEEEEEEGEEEEEEEEEEEDEQEEQRQPQIDQQLSSQHQR
uniref:Resistance to inhibitors of cholinesterase protein 3 N-terminal domain-containing protein n=1 Tax=Clastoptera arizonana TaxID=38151 RepID=A0A1B6C4L9_9HEMI